jgi:hypothetical protein
MTHIKLYKKLRIEIHELYVHKRYFKVSEIKWSLVIRYFSKNKIIISLVIFGETVIKN